MAITLKGRVKKEISESIYTNKSFWEHRWNVNQRISTKGSKYIVAASIAILILNGLIFLSVYLSADWMRQKLPNTEQGLDSFLNYPLLIFTGQLTLLSLVFPLVIAFVGILLQGRSGHKVLWSVYRNTSGFMLFGASSLLLVLSFLILAPSRIFLNTDILLSLSCMFLFWFTCNLLLIARFFLMTIKFISPTERQDLILNYTINEVLISDIKNRLLQNLSVSAQEIELLPIKTEGINSVKLYGLEQEDTNIIEKKFGKGKNLVNINYLFLRWAITIQSIKNIIFLGQKTDTTSYLKLLAMNSGYPRRTFILASSQPIDFNFFSKYLIYASYSFSGKSAYRHLALDEVIDAIFGQIEDALKDNHVDAFRKSVDHLRHFQLCVEASLSFKNDDGDPDNWLLLPSGGLFGLNYLQSFVQGMNKVGNEATYLLKDNKTFFGKWCYVYPLLSGGSELNRPHNINITYIEGHYYIWGILNNWIIHTAPTESIKTSIIEDSIKTFVGSWESWSMRLPALDEKDFDVQNIKTLRAHLDYTSLMVANSRRLDLASAAIWACDVLVHWFDLFSSYTTWVDSYGWSYEALTLTSILSVNEKELISEITNSERSNEAEIAFIAVRNYWTDVRIITAAYLLSSKEELEKEEYLKTIIKSLVEEERLKPSSDSNQTYSSVQSPQALLGVYLRMNADYESDPKYRYLIESHLERLINIEAPAYVPGRLYTGNIYNNSSVLIKFFKIFCAGMAEKEFSLSGLWLNFLKNELIASKSLTHTIERIGKLTSVDDSDRLVIMDFFDIPKNEACKRIDNFENSIKSIISQLESTFKKSIPKVEVDQEIVVAHGKAASLSSFNLNTGPFPIFLFDDIEYVDDVGMDNKNRVIINNYNRSDFSKEYSNGPSGNDSDQIDSIMRSSVTNALTKKIFKNIEISEERTYDDGFSVIRMATSDAESFQQEPSSLILLVGSKDLWEFFRRYAFDEKVNGGLIKNSRSGFHQSQSYLCNLGQIEVHRTPNVSATILTSKSNFRRLDVWRISDGLYVDADFKPESDDSNKGMLILTFGIELLIEGQKAVKYVRRGPASVSNGTLS